MPRYQLLRVHRNQINLKHIISNLHTRHRPQHRFVQPNWNETTPSRVVADSMHIWRISSTSVLRRGKREWRCRVSHLGFFTRRRSINVLLETNGSIVTRGDVFSSPGGVKTPNICGRRTTTTDISRNNNRYGTASTGKPHRKRLPAGSHTKRRCPQTTTSHESSCETVRFMRVYANVHHAGSFSCWWRHVVFAPSAVNAASCRQNEQNVRIISSRVNWGWHDGYRVERPANRMARAQDNGEVITPRDADRAGTPPTRVTAVRRSRDRNASVFYRIFVWVPACAYRTPVVIGETTIVEPYALKKKKKPL